MKLLLKNAFLFENNSWNMRDVLVDNGRIVSVSQHCMCDGDTTVVDLKNLYLVPGFVDVHVHLREPGFSYKETIATGTAAAARGGYTAVCSMPNLNPTPDTQEHLQEQLALIEKDALVRVLPYGCITVGQKGQEMADLAAMAPYVAAFSDDGKGVQDAGMMRRAMLQAKELDKIIAAHCEDESLLRGGYIHDGEYARTHGHRGICSESEYGQIARDIALVEQTGCRYHVCHISTKESVELIRRAKSRGLPVTCETAPHYLLLCDEDLQEDGRFKMNPPLRSAEDRAALLEGLLDGTIDMIATDHAPHTAEEKGRGLEKSLMGVVGLECAFPALYTGLVKPGHLPLHRLVELMSDAPRRIFGLGGGLQEGQPADLAVLDIRPEWTIDPKDFLSMGRATPFAGLHVTGKNVMTIVGGKIVWQER